MMKMLEEGQFQAQWPAPSRQTRAVYDTCDLYSSIGKSAIVMVQQLNSDEEALYRHFISIHPEDLDAGSVNSAAKSTKSNNWMASLVKVGSQMSIASEDGQESARVGSVVVL